MAVRRAPSRRGWGLKERELPLTALRAFAVAARSRNLAAAADQLGVTHGAVSKQIATLEARLGQSLFVRHRRSLELTPYGRVLAERVSEAMRDIAAACDYVRRDRSRRAISVEAPATFAMYFLLPRIKAFEALHPSVSVWISTRVTGQPADLLNHDVVISRGPLEHGLARTGRPRLLFTESLTPVGAIPLLRRMPVRRPKDVAGHATIASASRPGEWEDWFARAELGKPMIEGGHRFDHLNVALHAVRDGLGLTIAPLQFFNDATRPYGLRCPLPRIVIPGRSYFAQSTHKPGTADAETFMTWLQDLCEADDA
ncbi:LysR substrate-binding domain-containing protein [Hansschlegelia plantiphila]|uniref:LysR substrate-binding domain-containing protein n=1 Tax=Hansschlegelia plantiphila TaxID=374655 RepID=UPI0022F28CF5|nr:LysR substrate-binding domain-containing protein [Hansschlegelia plantiphila]